MKIQELSINSVSCTVPRNIKGIYYLGNVRNGAFKVSYIGRSDSCLRGRLLRHARAGRYGYFSYLPCSTEKLAYKHECYAYHSFIGLDNKIHPDSNGDCTCPICEAVKLFKPYYRMV